MYILGDVIDRGPESIELLQDVMEMKNITLLLGNHEYMMIMHTKGRRDGDCWTSSSNGGSATLWTYSMLPDTERRRIRGYIESLPLQVELQAGGKTFLLSHSAFLPNDGTCYWYGMYIEDVFHTVWYSPWRFFEFEPLDTYTLDEREHIIGHVPVQLIPVAEWPEGSKPDTPCFLRDKEHHLANIDLGCALIPTMTAEPEYRTQYKDAGLCVLDLERYAFGAEDVATYVMSEINQ